MDLVHVVPETRQARSPPFDQAQSQSLSLASHFTAVGPWMAVHAHNRPYQPNEIETRYGRACRLFIAEEDGNNG